MRKKKDSLNINSEDLSSTAKDKILNAVKEINNGKAQGAKHIYIIFC